MHMYVCMYVGTYHSFFSVRSADTKFCSYKFKVPVPDAIWIWNLYHRVTPITAPIIVDTFFAASLLAAWTVDKGIVHNCDH